MVSAKRDMFPLTVRRDWSFARKRFLRVERLLLSASSCSFGVDPVGFNPISHLPSSPCWTVVLSPADLPNSSGLSNKSILAYRKLFGWHERAHLGRCSRVRAFKIV